MESVPKPTPLRPLATAEAGVVLPPVRSGILGFRERSRLGHGPQARDLERHAVSLESRCPGTYGHSHRVGGYALQLARGMKLGRREVSRIRRAAVLHDIGKSRTPSEIVNKPGPLTPAEYAIVCRHAEIGAAMVSELGDAALTAIVRHHHERWDGSGYPDGLEAEEIPIGARIVAVADTFDALTSKRPYREAKGYGEALEILLDESGAQFDPALVTQFHDRYVDLWD
jgi:putative nucleotidyltransferase with HDIG domain